MVKAIEPRKIIYYVALQYLEESVQKELKNDIFNRTFRSDCAYVKAIEKYFDFSILIKNPKQPEDAWLYNYLMYETKRKESQSPLMVGEEINFSGRMPKKGLIVKYSNFLKKTGRTLY